MAYRITGELMFIPWQSDRNRSDNFVGYLRCCQRLVLPQEEKAGPEIIILFQTENPMVECLF
jgi:hypothetical protein